MKLIKARVQNYRSVEDSEEFEIGDLTCLVGKGRLKTGSVLDFTLRRPRWLIEECKVKN